MVMRVTIGCLEHCAQTAVKLKARKQLQHTSHRVQQLKYTSHRVQQPASICYSVVPTIPVHTQAHAYTRTRLLTHTQAHARTHKHGYPRYCARMRMRTFTGSAHLTHVSAACSSAAPSDDAAEFRAR